MSRFRLSVRRMLAVVAVVALILAAIVLGGRSEEYRRRAEEHHLLHLSHEGAAELGWQSPGALGAGDSAERQARLALYHDNLSQKYWVAACRPWRSVPDDPPPP